ncbi:unknown [Firmicutes bacterium CAG:240]|nr:unknown [Firmicutes bacterium CAG:240]
MLGVFHFRILKPRLAQRLYRKRRRFRRDLGRNVAEPHAPVLLRDVGSEVPDRSIGIEVYLQAADINVFVHNLTLLFKAMPSASAAQPRAAPAAALSIYC